MKRLSPTLALALAAWGVLMVNSSPALGAQTDSPEITSKGEQKSDTPAPNTSDTGITVTPGDSWFTQYRFHDGTTMGKVRIHYATIGRAHRDRRGRVDNAVLMLHWTGGDGKALSSNVYKAALFAPGQPLDASRYFIILPDSIGHGLSTKPSDGLHAKFPDYDFDDMVDLQHRLVTDVLKIDHLHAIIGMSMGGMNTWDWAERYPGMMDGVMPVVAQPIRVAGRNLLWRRIAIDTIRNDPSWKHGEYRQPPRDWSNGYRVLRMMVDSVADLQGEIPDDTAADRFLAATDRQARLVDPNDALYSLKASFSYNPEPRLSAISTKVFALDFTDDAFNPDTLHVLERIVPTLPHGRFVIQPGTDTSPGHYTMTRPDLWAQQVATFMKWIEEPDGSVSK